MKNEKLGFTHMVDVVGLQEALLYLLLHPACNMKTSKKEI